MPQITIREKDYTSPGSGLYTNYAVLVPGFYSATDNAANGTGSYAFDDNGVYECSSRAEFIEKIGRCQNGRVAATQTVAPTLTVISDGTTYGTLSDSLRTQYAGHIYSRTTSVGVGHLDDGTYKYDLATDIARVFATGVTYYTKNDSGTFTEVASGTTPEINTDYYIHTGSGETEADYTKAELMTSRSYSIITPGNEGTDYNIGVAGQYGNQIAYELLDLGYNILYLNLGKYDTNDGARREAIAKLAVVGTDANSIWNPLYDKANYDFRFVINGLIESNAAANRAICQLASGAIEVNNNVKGRGDCTALIDVDESIYSSLTTKTQNSIISAIKTSVNAIDYADKNSAIFTPSVCYKLTLSNEEKADFNNNVKFPASFHYLACFAYSLGKENPEWFAAAGYSRGISDYVVDSPEVKLGEVAINELEPRYTKTTNGINKAVNVIAKVRNSYYMWGNRTANTLIGEAVVPHDLIASDFLNIRQLCTTLKKQIYTTCRRYTFDPNSDVLWFNFCNGIKPTLENMRGREGVSDYQIVRVESSQKGKMKARVRIVPIEAVEDFDIDITLEDSIGDATVSITE